MNLPDAYPLQWPDGWERTPMHERKKSRYSVTPSTAMQNLRDSVRKLGGDAAIMSSNLDVGVRGVARVGNPTLLADPGVAIHWARNGKVEVMACDHWRTPWENMQAIHKAIEGLRAMERAGATQIVERAFHAFVLPKPETWRDVLGIEEGFCPSKKYLHRTVREALLVAHPDRRGNEADFKRIEKAGAEARKELGYEAQSNERTVSSAER
jgi:hypothetical protein